MSKKNKTVYDLPEKGVIFLGGHNNMTNKLKQLFSKWVFISNDYITRHNKSLNQNLVFYWSGHISHSMSDYVYSKISNDVDTIYVTATNMQLLISEMQKGYKELCMK